jgi:hypothetical protein
MGCLSSPNWRSHRVMHAVRLCMKKSQKFATELPWDAYTNKNETCGFSGGRNRRNESGIPVSNHRALSPTLVQMDPTSGPKGDTALVPPSVLFAELMGRSGFISL